MPILDAISTAQMQILRHLLQELEAEGVPSLTAARLRLDTEEKRRRRDMRIIGAGRGSRLRPTHQPRPCPECGKPLTLANVEDALISVCRACRWSAIVEG
jgi:hypothetical protein